MTANLSLDLIPEFNHKAPEGYSYEVEEFKRNVLSIWLRCHRQFDYNNGKGTRTIWGFFSSKKREFYSPVNSCTVGKVVDFNKTRNYSAMTINYQGLEQFFV
jgi:hypothetical protein